MLFCVVRVVVSLCVLLLYFFCVCPVVNDFLLGEEGEMLCNAVITRDLSHCTPHFLTCPESEMQLLSRHYGTRAYTFIYLPCVEDQTE